MVYLYLNKNVIKLIYLKKTLLGQQETSFFEKTYETDLVVNGSVANIDLLASAIKEAFTSGGERAVADRDVSLILPQESFYFLRTTVPVDVAPTAMTSFIFDKARASFPISPDDCYTASYVRESGGEKVINFFGINRETLDAFRQALSLIDLKIQSVVPETLAYFKLFEKTLRAEKKENILYLTLSNGTMSGYLFDSYGLLDDKKIELTKTEEEKIETVIKTKVDALSEKNIKLNRLILSGEPSDKVRQDTFTKAVSVWTNPLKRIVPTFYDEYLKLLVVESKKTFPILTFDVCFGAFIFASENKGFSFFKGGVPMKKTARPGISLPKIGLPRREILLFVGSFALSFLLFLAFSRIKLPNFGEALTVKTATPTPAPTVTPTPTPSFAKEDLKIQVLNGGGVAGKATDVKEILTDKGYLDIITGNADNFDYEKTELQVKKSKAQAYQMVRLDLEDYVTSPRQLTLNEEETADVVVIIGADFK